MICALLIRSWFELPIGSFGGVFKDLSAADLGAMASAEPADARALFEEIRAVGLLGEKGQAQQAAFTMLASRPAWSLRLLETVQSGQVAVAAVPELLEGTYDPSERMGKPSGAP